MLLTFCKLFVIFFLVDNIDTVECGCSLPQSKMIGGDVMTMNNYLSICMFFIHYLFLCIFFLFLIIIFLIIYIIKIKRNHATVAISNRD